MTDIGSTLREARMHARIDISEVELRTKIRAKYLRAIENEEWDLLPGPVYVKSFLRTYGEYLGLDTRLLVDEYKRRYEHPAQDARAVTGINRERERPRDSRGGSRGSSRGGARSGGRGGRNSGRGGGRTAMGRQTGGSRSPIAAALLSPKALIGVVLLAIVAALYLIGSHGGGKSPADNDPGKHIAPHGTTVRHHAPKTHEQKTTPTPTGTTTKPPRVNATLALIPTGTVYVCVENAAGKALIPGEIFSDGDKVPTVTSKKLLVTLGNADVQVTTNGKPHPVTASTSAIAFKVTPKGVHALSSGPTCEG
jgi:cytoskeleton protein RodZ